MNTLINKTKKENEIFHAFIILVWMLAFKSTVTSFSHDLTQREKVCNS